MNSKKSLLLVSFMLVQSVHSSLKMLSNYSNQILSAGMFALAEYQIRTQKEPQLSIFSIKLDEDTEKEIAKSSFPLITKFFYSIMSYRELKQEEQNIIWKNSVYQLFNFLELFSFHEFFVEKHKNYKRSLNVVSSLFNTLEISSLKFQDRLRLFSFLYLPKMYCNLENSPLFFAGLNLHWIISIVLLPILNTQLTSTSNAMNNESYIKKLIYPEFDQRLPLYQLALTQSFAFCRACGILKNPFPNEYHLLPKNITHYAHQPDFKGKITLLGINLCQKIGYLFFIRHIIFKAFAVINDYAAQPVADFCIKKPSNENQEKIKNSLCLFASGVIILFCCEKMLQRLYQNLDIRP